MARKISAWMVGFEGLVFTLLEGSMLTLGLVVAPVLFKSIESRDQAGKVFGNILNVWFWLGLVCTLILIGTGALGLSRSKTFKKIWVARFFITLTMLGLLVGFGFVLNRINTIQSGLTKPIEEYPGNADPRLEFDRLHGLSSNLLSADLVFGIVWLVISAVLISNLSKGTAPVNFQALKETKRDETVSPISVS